MHRAPPAAGPELALTRELGTLALVAVATLTTLIAGAELACRIPALQARLPTQSYGGGLLLDTDLARLRTLTTEPERLDCLILGSSVVFRGLDPLQISAGYERSTRHSLRCYAIGVPWLTPRTAAALAPILLTDYRPHALVYALNAWDVRMSDPLDSPELNAWVEYRNGLVTLYGWLTDHSTAYRYYLTLRHRLRFSAEDLALARYLQQQLTPYGYLPSDVVFTGPLSGPHDTGPPPQTALNKLGESLPQLARIAADSAVRLVLIEMPTPQTNTLRPPGGTGSILDMMAGISGREVLAFRTVSRGEVPPDGFADLVHLNRAGAEVFSDSVGRWLGEVLRDPAAPRLGTVHPPET